VLADGTYDVVVVDATDLDDPPGAIQIELTLLAGEHKGELLALTTSTLGRDPLDLLAAPGTLVVADGVPHLRLEG
jgi:hypothetical protein